MRHSFCGGTVVIYWQDPLGGSSQLLTMGYFCQFFINYMVAWVCSSFSLAPGFLEPILRSCSSVKYTWLVSFPQESYQTSKTYTFILLWEEEQSSLNESLFLSFFKIVFIFLLAALGLYCCMGFIGASLPTGATSKRKVMDSSLSWLQYKYLSFKKLTELV